MSFRKIHGFSLAANSWAENFHVERLPADPAVLEAGRVWYNNAEKCLKYSLRTEDNNLVIRKFINDKLLKEAFEGLDHRDEIRVVVAEPFGNAASVVIPGQDENGSIKFISKQLGEVGNNLTIEYIVPSEPIHSVNVNTVENDIVVNLASTAGEFAGIVLDQIEYVSKIPGTVGNSISIEYTQNNTESLTVSVSGNNITVDLMTGTKTTDIVTVINGDIAASELVTLTPSDAITNFTTWFNEGDWNCYAEDEQTASWSNGYFTTDGYVINLERSNMAADLPFEKAKTLKLFFNKVLSQIQIFDQNNQLMLDASPSTSGSYEAELDWETNSSTYINKISMIFSTFNANLTNIEYKEINKVIETTQGQVFLENGVDGTVSTTAADIVGAILTTPSVNNLVSVSLIGDGSGLVQPSAKTNFNGGNDLDYIPTVIDTVAVELNDRILVKNASNPVNNGIMVVDSIPPSDPDYSIGTDCSKVTYTPVGDASPTVNHLDPGIANQPVNITVEDQTVNISLATGQDTPQIGTRQSANTYNFITIQFQGMGNNYSRVWTGNTDPDQTSIIWEIINNNIYCHPATNESGVITSTYQDVIDSIPGSIVDGLFTITLGKRWNPSEHRSVSTARNYTAYLDGITEITDDWSYFSTTPINVTTNFITYIPNQRFSKLIASKFRLTERTGSLGITEVPVLIKDTAGNDILNTNVTYSQYQFEDTTIDYDLDLSNGFDIASIQIGNEVTTVTGGEFSIDFYAYEPNAIFQESFIFLDREIPYSFMLSAFELTQAVNLDPVASTLVTASEILGGATGVVDYISNIGQAITIWQDAIWDGTKIHVPSGQFNGDVPYIHNPVRFKITFDTITNAHVYLTNSSNSHAFHDGSAVTSGIWYDIIPDPSDIFYITVEDNDGSSDFNITSIEFEVPSSPVVTGSIEVYTLPYITVSRASDANSNSNVVPGMFCFVLDGQKYKNTSFVLTNKEKDIDVGVKPLNFTQFTSVTEINAGPGLEKDGTDFSVKVDGTSIVVSENGIKVSDDYMPDLSEIDTQLQFLSKNYITNDDVSAGQLVARVDDNQVSIANLFDISPINNDHILDYVGARAYQNNIYIDSIGDNDYLALATYLGLPGGHHRLFRFRVTPIGYEELNQIELNNTEFGDLWEAPIVNVNDSMAVIVSNSDNSIWIHPVHYNSDSVTLGTRIDIPIWNATQFKGITATKMSENTIVIGFAYNLFYQLLYVKFNGEEVEKQFLYAIDTNNDRSAKSGQIVMTSLTPTTGIIRRVHTASGSTSRTSRFTAFRILPDIEEFELSTETPHFIGNGNFGYPRIRRLDDNRFIAATGDMITVGNIDPNLEITFGTPAQLDNDTIELHYSVDFTTVGPQLYAFSGSTWDTSTPKARYPLYIDNLTVTTGTGVMLFEGYTYSGHLGINEVGGYIYIQSAYRDSDSKNLFSIHTRYASEGSAFLGISDVTTTAGNEIKVVLEGVVSQYTDLIPGQYYYQGNNGELSTTGNILVGRAISSTDLQILLSGPIVTDDSNESTPVVTKIIELSDTPNLFGTENQVLAINPTVDGMVWINIPSITQIETIYNSTGLSEDGLYVTSTNPIISSASSLSDADKKLALSITTLTTSINSKVFTFTSDNPATTHTITHNLNSNNLEITVWVYNTSTNKYEVDTVGISQTNQNVIVVDLTESANIKAIIRDSSVVSYS